MLKLFNKYNGEFGSLEVDFTEKRVNDAIQWQMVADKAEHDSKKFVHITRKMLNELFDTDRVEYALKDQNGLKRKVEDYLQEDNQQGGMDVSVIYDNNDNFSLHLDFNNNSFLK
ncbi:hypothetical protein OW763_12270 [Clostridium aestuarii]|uniref:Uncharacterized protein n=1 Tax=Clostridium aestuarii TaxID=338193 RepID=A0ABT4D1I9_9CLOT|nr:hypothetical protein [Clostridium aestuarii]MCY6485113.1 hypothetical protein [Clostridium aestuarii]